MSRSYKHTPYCGDNKSKFNKRQANRRVRHNKEPLNHGSYKKKFESWDICDYSSCATFKKFWQHTLQVWYAWGYKYYPYPDKKEEYRYWYKCYKMK